MVMVASFGQILKPNFFKLFWFYFSLHLCLMKFSSTENYVTYVSF